MHAFKLLLLAPLALASTIASRQSAGAEQILQSISNIDEAVQALNRALVAYDGGINEADPVFSAALNIHQVNRQGYEANMKVAGPLSSADSQAIDRRVDDTVGVSIPESAKLMEAKKPLFDQAAVSSLLLAGINLLKYDHETFSLVVGEKLSPDAVPGGLAGAGKIEAVLVELSAYYTV